MRRATSTVEVEGEWTTGGRGATESPSYSSAEECREVIERVMARVVEEEDLVERLRSVGLRQRLEITDLGVVLNVDLADASDGVRWAVGDDIEWEPELRLSMSAEVANRYFQGEENMVLAVARRRIRAVCEDAHCVLRWHPASQPLIHAYREVVEEDFPHLVV